MQGPMTRSEAYAAYGVQLRNIQWSWSGCSADGKTVALTFWYHRFNAAPEHPVIYDDTGWGGTEIEVRTGNRFRKKDILHALYNLDGEVRVVLACADNAGDIPHGVIPGRYYVLPDLRMRIVCFNNKTGEWTAESIAPRTRRGSC